MLPSRTDDAIADCLGDGVQPGQRRSRRPARMLPSAATKKPDAVQADRHLGMITQTYQLVVGTTCPAAPASVAWQRFAGGDVHVSIFTWVVACAPVPP